MKKTSWMYTKSGNIGSYGAQVALLPDHGVGFSVLAAGTTAARHVEILAGMVSAAYAPALEAAAKEEACSVYAGTYQDEKSNSTLTVAVKDSDPGLVVSEWIFHGSDVLTLYGEIVGANASAG